MREAIDRVLKSEGGCSTDPSDRGGETMGGVARKYWPHWPGWPRVDEQRAAGKEPKITPHILGLLHTFYREHFWDRMHCDSFPPTLAYEIFDMAVNMGVGRTSELLQESLNLLNRNGKSWREIAVDGRIGPITLTMVHQALVETSGEAHMLRLLVALQAEHYLTRARRQPSQERFLRGWLRRA